MKNYLVQFYANDFGWQTSKRLPEGTSSKYLAEKTLKEATKKNPHKHYRLISFDVLKEIKPVTTCYPPVEEHIAEVAGRIFQKLVESESYQPQH